MKGFLLVVVGFVGIVWWNVLVKKGGVQGFVYETKWTVRRGDRGGRYGNKVRDGDKWMIRNRIVKFGSKEEERRKEQQDRVICQGSLLGVNEENFIRKFPVATRILRMIVRRIIHRISLDVKGLDVRIYADSNRHVLSGSIRLVDVFLDAIVFPNMRISGGSHFQVEGLDLKMRTLLVPSFLSFWKRRGTVKKAFEIYADCVMTEYDISSSPIFLNVVQAVIDSVLDAVFNEKVATVMIQRIEIAKKKLAVRGVAVTTVTGKTPFLFTTNILASDNGHRVNFDRPTLRLNPDSIPTILPVSGLPPSIYLGDDARIESLKIDNKALRMVARSVIHPMPPLTVGDVSVSTKNEFYFDLSRFLSEYLKNMNVIV